MTDTIRIGIEDDEDDCAAEVEIAADPPQVRVEGNEGDEEIVLLAEDDLSLEED